MKASLKLHCFHFYGTERSSGSGQVSIPVMQVFCFCFFQISVSFVSDKSSGGFVFSVFLFAFLCCMFIAKCIKHIWVYVLIQEPKLESQHGFSLIEILACGGRVIYCHNPANNSSFCWLLQLQSFYLPNALAQMWKYINLV